jgi:hypothetical protein
LNKEKARSKRKYSDTIAGALGIPEGSLFEPCHLFTAITLTQRPSQSCHFPARKIEGAGICQWPTHHN